jgi:nitrogen fixation NifU-like protein
VIATGIADDVRDLYQDTILRHARTPLHRGALTPFDAEAAGDNPMCGDRCTVRVRFGVSGALARVAFEGRGCAISMASADLMAEVVQGLDEAAARALAADFRVLAKTGDVARNDSAIAALRPLSGVAEYPSRVKCATLPWAALIAALDGAKEASSE